MVAFTLEMAQKHADKVIETFEDGFQITDLFTIVPQIMQIVQAVGGMSGAEKLEAASVILDLVIDKTDTPWLPDNLTDPILKKGFRAMIPVLIKTAKGEFTID